MRARTIPIVIASLFASAASGQDVDRTFHFANSNTIQGMQEIGTVIRTIPAIRDVTVDTAQRTLILHSTAGQAALAEWLFNELDKPANLPPPQPNGPAMIEYRVPGSNDDVVRVFYLTYMETLQSFQEIATLVRSTGDIRRLLTYNTAKAIAMRGTADQAALAEWLIGELDKPVNPTDSAVHEFHMAGTEENVVRVFYLPHSGTLQHFQEIVTFVRSTTQIRRAFTYNAPRALTMRGTADQIAQANQLIQERDKP